MKKEFIIPIVAGVIAVAMLYAFNGRSHNDDDYDGIELCEDSIVDEGTAAGTGGTRQNTRPSAMPDSVGFIYLPSPLNGVSESIIYRKAYIVSYNKDTRNPNWVAWHLTAEHADGPYERSDDFYEDEEVEAPRATLADYRRSGWSRGHMCPAGDNKWDEEAMHESFSLVNICPQDTRLNSGLWNSIEMNCRTWARRYGDIYIVCGPVYLNREHVTIGANRVVVPEAFFKVVLCLNGTPKAFGIVVRNNSGQRKRDLYYNSVDEVERVTGMDFFHTLPDDIENEVEATANIEEW